MKPITAKRAKQKYDVYYIGEGEGCYAKDYYKEYVGSTFAVNESQACNNVRYRLKDRGPNGGYAYDEIGDCLEEGSVSFYFKAYLAEN